jgi:hypothetical protein
MMKSEIRGIELVARKVA